MNIMTQRLNYNTVAHQYDAHHTRRKAADQNLQSFLSQRTDTTSIRVLDIGCGTGSQLVANQTEWPKISCVGLDYHIGMLNQAQRKSQSISWIQASGDALPFPDHSFDYITNQFAFHHIPKKETFITEVFRILRPNGRFVMSNICPSEMPNWALYRYFPTTYEVDIRDFMPAEQIRQHLKNHPFSMLTNTFTYFLAPITRQSFADMVTHKDPSQCHIIPNEEYLIGIGTINREIKKHGEDSYIENESCLLEIIADKK